MRGKKTAPFYFCNSFVRTSSITIIFGTHIHKYMSYHACIPYSLYNQRRGTILGFKSTAGQHSMHTQPSCSFVTRQLTFSYSA